MNNNIPYAADNPDDPAQMRQKAEACRRLAELSEDADRKALWLERADHWEKLAARVAEAAARPPT